MIWVPLLVPPSRTITSSELSEHLLRTAEVPVHAHSTEHVDSLGELCPRLLNLARGREQMSLGQAAPRQLW